MTEDPLRGEGVSYGKIRSPKANGDPLRQRGIPKANGDPVRQKGSPPRGIP